MDLQVELQRPDAQILARFRELSTRRDVAELLEIPERLLVSILYLRKEPLRYRTFFIPKRSGGQRAISSPPANLAILQRKLNRVCQLAYRPKASVHGFVRGRSILSNATLHVGKRWLLNVNLKDFFPSMNFGCVREMFAAAPYNIAQPAATVLAQLCCAENALPQGAPTSPVVANMVCSRMDGELMSLARHHGATYSRYGDDISFSLRRPEFPSDLAFAVGGWTGSGVRVGDALNL